VYFVLQTIATKQPRNTLKTRKKRKRYIVDINSYILVGGRSSRLGRDKATVDLNGRTLLGRAVDVVHDGLHPTRITAVAANAAQFAIDAIAADVPFIFDLHEDRGPLGGLHAALADAKTPWIFVLACDYPFVSAELIELLNGMISDDFDCILPEQEDGRLQPLCAFYKVEALRAVVDEVIQRPRVPPPMHEIVSGLRTRVVMFAEYEHLPRANDLFCNINTTDDIERAMGIERLSGPRS
jgi:molybdopterin-guanine dinucleotide biosynthesis protein A